jgi:S-DNA-T family DNA segregation ATPase FtsK/SpoIIIE
MARKKSNAGAAKKAKQRRNEQKREICGVLLIGVALLALLAAYFYGAGYVGAVLQRGLEYLFGEQGEILPIIFIMATGILMLVRRRTGIGKRRLAALLMFALLTLVGLHLLSPVPLNMDNLDEAYKGSGVIGHYCAFVLIRNFGRIGTLVFLGAWIMVMLILVADQPLTEICKRFWRTAKKQPSPQPGPAAAPGAEPPNAVYEHYANEAAPAAAVNPESPGAAANPEKGENQVTASLRKFLKGKPKAETKAEVKAEAKPGTKIAANAKPEELLSNPPVKAGPYKLPDLNLVGEPKQILKNQGLDQARQLQETLASFGVQVRVLEVHHGPVITRYDLQPAPGVKVSKIVNLTDDLALALAAKGLRLEAPIPGKAAIGVEVPNKETRVVTLREVLEAKSFWNSGKLSIGLGVDIGGEVVVADLSKMPHLLVAGSTGSGKSVCINTMIMSVLYKAFPDEVKFIMIDPKMVELSMYNGIPHLMAPVVTEAKKASGVLHMVVTEMERRYKMFAEARVRELHKYNEQLTEGEPLPHIVVIIDELADLMMVAPVEVEDSICRLAQMARATGIHLVVATQRPSVDVITGLIKANIPSRIAFAVSSQIDSRTILDSPGAERLLGRGDMLFAPVGSMKSQRIQGALVTEKEIEAVIKHWKEQGEPDYQEQYINIPEKEEKATPAEVDDLFWEAIRVVIENGQASASVLQRRLRVGYTRAARLVDMMESQGLIGPYEGSKPREVYITARQLEELKNRSQTQQGQS